MSLDTRKAFRDLRASGASGADEPLADAIVDLFRQASDMPDVSSLATKDDVALAKAEVRADIAEFKAGLEIKMGGLESRMGRLDNRIGQVENRVIVWIAASTVISAFANGGFQFLAKVLHLG